MTKDKRLQIRVTDQELVSIQRRAKAVGLSVAEYGRTRLLAEDAQAIPKQGLLGFEDLGLIGGEILEPDSPEDAAADLGILESVGLSASDWQSSVDDGPNYDADLGAECSVKDVPPGVRCIECGLVHGF